MEIKLWMKLIQCMWKHPFSNILKEKESLKPVQYDIEKSYRKPIIQVIRQYKSTEEKN